MASSSGITSPGSSSSLQQISSSDQRKRKRMQSNRESARRSRMRKQKHLDDLMVQVTNLRTTNNQVLNNINITTQQLVKIELENSVLRAQMAELNSRFQSLNEIINALNCSNNNNQNQNLGVLGGDYGGEGVFSIIPEPFTSDGFVMNPWNSTDYANQPIMASADMFQY